MILIIRTGKNNDSNYENGKKQNYIIKLMFIKMINYKKYKFEKMIN